MKIRVRGMRGAKKLVTDAISDDNGPTVAERARTLRAVGKGDEAARLVARATGMSDDEAAKFVDALD